MEVMEVMSWRKRTPRGGSLVTGVVIGGSVMEVHTFSQVWSGKWPKE